jgi:hypothetical protein
MSEPTKVDYQLAQDAWQELKADVAPLIAALQAQLAWCGIGDECKPCNQARAALTEFQKKYPK